MKVELERCNNTEMSLLPIENDTGVRNLDFQLKQAFRMEKIPFLIKFIQMRVKVNMSGLHRLLYIIIIIIIIIT